MSNSCVHSRARAPLADARAPVMSDDARAPSPPPSARASPRARSRRTTTRGDAHYDALLEWSTADGRDGSCNAPVARDAPRDSPSARGCRASGRRCGRTRCEATGCEKLEALTAAGRLWIDAPGRAGWREQLEKTRGVGGKDERRDGL